MRNIDMKNETYLDVTTFVNTVKELALNDLGLSHEKTPYIIEDIDAYGRTAHSEGGFVAYVGIRQEQSMKSMINTIFHESRHIWQIRKYEKYIDRRIERVRAGKGPKTFFQYWIQPVEIGARVYAYFAMKRLSKQIDEIVEKYTHGLLEEKYC